MSTTQPSRRTAVIEEKQVKMDRNYLLILWNDDVNTFQHVIFCLVHYLDYTENTAEKLAYKVHNDGKSPVLQGTFTEMEVYRKILKGEGLTVTVE